jgi:hypothetical protein
VAAAGLLRPRQYVVCVQQIHDDFCLKILTVNDYGDGICQRQQGDDHDVRCSPLHCAATAPAAGAQQPPP